MGNSASAAAHPSAAAAGPAAAGAAGGGGGGGGGGSSAADASSSAAGASAATAGLLARMRQRRRGAGGSSGGRRPSQVHLRAALVFAWEQQQQQQQLQQQQQQQDDEDEDNNDNDNDNDNCTFGLGALPREVVREVVLLLPLGLHAPPDYRRMAKPAAVWELGGSPQFLAADPETGLLAVPDSSGESAGVLLLDPLRGGKVVHRVNSSGADDAGGAFYSTAFLPQGRLLVNAKRAKRVFRHSPKLVPAVARAAVGGADPTDEELAVEKKAHTHAHAWGMATCRDTGHTFVATPLSGDTARVHEFNERMHKIRSLGTKDDWPHDCCVDREQGRLLCSTTGGVISSSLDTGRFTKKVQSLSTVSRPMGIDIDSDGTYAVVDQSSRKLVFFDKDDFEIHNISLKSHCTSPVGVAISPFTGHVYVSDESKGRVVVFAEDDEL